MPTHLKHSTTVIIAISLIICSCSTTRYRTKVSAVPNSRKLLSSYYSCKVTRLPSVRDTELTVSFEKVNQYELLEQKRKVKEIDNQGTRLGGWVTMGLGALIGGIVAVGGNDDDGNYIEPNPGAGKGILIGSLLLGGIMAIIPNSSEELSSTTTSLKYEAYESIQDQDSVYTIWSNIYPQKVISRTLVNEELNLDVVTDLGLNYFENEDSIQVYFKSHWDETLIYTVDFLASDYLKRYLNTNEMNDGISLYQAPTINAPVISQLRKGDVLEFLEKKGDWYKVLWNQRNVYLKAGSIGYFFASQ